MHAPVRTEYVTDDLTRAPALMTAAYGASRVRVCGDPGDYRVELARADLGELRLDVARDTLTTEYRLDPLGQLLVVRVLGGAVDAENHRVRRRLGPGDVYLPARPDQAHVTRSLGARVQVTGVDLSLLAQVDPDRVEERVTGLRLGPLPPETAGHWVHAVSYLRTTVLAGEQAASPLVLGAAGRLVAATLLTVFDAGVDRAPLHDRTDATPATLRRAIAYLETNGDLDIGVADVARDGRVSARAVQLAFRRHRDTTPLAYLRRVRLDRIHDELLAAEPGRDVTVRAVAARWGFADLGRLAVHYRAAFGESPGRTLLR